MSYCSSSGSDFARTVRKYVPERPPGQPRGDQRWSTLFAIMRPRYWPVTSVLS